MRAVLISIQPKWCELIASGKKTVEVRKTKPKIDVPFKCYIYETQGRTETPFVDEEGHEIFKGRGQVIGEFVCDNINSIEHTNGAIIEQGRCDTAYTLESSCIVLFDVIVNYMGKQEKAYGWHISDLVIYDKPKELSEFHIVGCKGCRDKDTYHCKFHCKAERRLKRPPQSWCYVEERSKA